MTPLSALSSPSLEEEIALWAAGHSSVAGLDEAGRGAWAGPVVAAAVVLPAAPDIAGRLFGVNDSKQLSARQRERLFETILAEALAVGVGSAPVELIDGAGIAPATRHAMDLAIAHLAVAPDFLLIDYVRLPAQPAPQRSLVKGDCRSLSIAAASIVAKVTRDRLMDELAACYQAYGFARNKGYGTPGHRAALERHGPCAAHRRSFDPVRGWQLQLFAETNLVEAALL